MKEIIGILFKVLYIVLLCIVAVVVTIISAIFRSAMWLCGSKIVFNKKKYRYFKRVQ